MDYIQHYGVQTLPLRGSILCFQMGGARPDPGFRHGRGRAWYYVQCLCSGDSAHGAMGLRRRGHDEDVRRIEGGCVEEVWVGSALGPGEHARGCCESGGIPGRGGE